MSDNDSTAINKTTNAERDYICKSCHSGITGTPRTTIECPNCHNLNFLFKNGTTRFVKKYVPNSFSILTRVGSFALSVFIIFYGSIGLTYNDVYIPGKRGMGIHFQDFTAILVYIAMIAVSAAMISLIVDHYDKKDNEKLYKDFRSATILIAVVLFVLAILLKILGDVPEWIVKTIINKY